LSKAFAAKTCIEAAPGDFVTVRGFDLSGAANLDVSGFDVAASPPDWGFRLGAGAQDIAIHNNLIHGGNYGVKFYAPFTWPRNIVVRDNDISHAVLDDVHVDGGEGVVIRHNFIHDVDLVTNSREHHDGIQVISGDEVIIDRNIFTFVSYRGVGGGQAIIIGHRDPATVGRKVSNVVISANLVHHWEGFAIAIAGVNGCKIVDNTAYDNSGNYGSNQALNMSAKNNPADFANTGVEVWNNIFNKVYIGNGSTNPTYASNNLAWPGSVIPAGSMGDNLLAVDPQFIDHVNYFLQPTSPAINSGVSRAATPDLDVGGTPFGIPDRGARAG
jgi:hypothetical protein